VAFDPATAGERPASSATIPLTLPKGPPDEIATATVASCLALVAAGCGQGGNAGNTPAPQGGGSVTVTAPLVKTASLENQTVEIGCGMCVYHMPGVEQCLPAIVLDGKPILVAGVELDLHEHDLCSNASKATVSGQVVGDGFVATRLDL
jgi:hypothetical protein